MTDTIKNTGHLPIRVLQVVTIMNRGGLETMLMNYYRHIDRSQVQFDFMVHRQERGAYDDEIESLGGRIYRMCPIHPKYFMTYLKELNCFFRTHIEYKIVHSHLNVLSTFVLKAASRNNVPVRISHSHNTSFADTGIRRLFKLYSRKHLTDECTHFWACSEVAGRFQFGNDIVDSGKLTIMRNAIDTKKLQFSDFVRRNIRDALHLDNKFVVGHVGRFTYQKNHKFIVDIFNEVGQIEHNTVLLMIGDGELRPVIESKVKQMGLENQVVFTGSVPNVNEYMMAMDVLLFPSFYEGLSVVCIEAQAAGLPVVASSSIAPATSLTPTFDFLDLNLPPSVWADQVLKYRNFDRHNNYNEIVASEYGIEQNARWLERFYAEATL